MTDVLTNLEAEVLRKLLSGDNEVLALLRRQLAVCRCSKRELTGGGFYTYLDVSTYGGARPKLNLKFGDVIASMRGLQNGAGFLLYIDDGFLTMLEGYSFGEPWPDQVDCVAVSYDHGEERDWQKLTRILGEPSIVGEES